MELRVRKRKDNTYFIQKRFLFIWFDCTDKLEVDSLFADGCVEDFSSEKDAEVFIQKELSKIKQNALWDKEYDIKRSIDKSYIPKKIQ